MIEKYIQFAIDNGFYKLENLIIANYQNKNTPTKNFVGQFVIYDTKYEREWGNPGSNASGIIEAEVDEYVDIIRLITSKPFIESVSRGIWRLGQEKQNKITDYLIEMIEKEIGEIQIGSNLNYFKLITFCLAIAIRENKLDEFIEKILPKK